MLLLEWGEMISSAMLCFSFNRRLVIVGDVQNGKNGERVVWLFWLHTRGLTKKGDSKRRFGLMLV
jgi:hypothetical protein